MNPVFFSNQQEFRNWLEENHKSETELWVGYYKVCTGRPSLTWSESVDQALCFGWIDGIRRKVDEESYCIRFTPRRPGSTWSNINSAKVEELKRQGLMKPEGLKAYSYRKEEGSGSYSYENEKMDMQEEYGKIFRENAVAWEYFDAQPPSYKKTMTRWIMSAKQDATRLNRLNKLISASEKNIRLY